MEEYDDDTHFCLKCHSTIIGLEYYVNHRKNNCMKQPDGSLPSLKADDFFSSLELQSSSKKILQPSTSGKQSCGILTRSKVSAFKETLEPSKSGKNAWIGGVQSKTLEIDDNPNIQKDIGRAKDIPRLQDYAYSDIESEDYELDDETSDDDAPPRNHTGGKWKPSSPIYWKQSIPEPEWRPPPPSFTGGKWKPAPSKRIFSPPPPHHTKGKWKPGQQPPDNEECSSVTLPQGKWSQLKKQETTSTPSDKIGKTKEDSPMGREEFPLSSEPLHDKWRVDEFIPSTYTKGKWKPPSSSPVPIPSYTGGKWKPGTSPDPSKNSNFFESKNSKYLDVSPFVKSSGSVQYWCKPCNRRLASKIVYERHLKSVFHIKRTMRENELEENLNCFKTSRSSRKRNVTHLEEKRENRDTDKKKTRRKTFEKCIVCHSKVNLYLMGKHLISHYHCKKSDLTMDIAQKVILENFDSIIKESPFQCTSCRYFFNHHEDFLDHWRSEEHKLLTESKIGEFLCSYCKFSCEKNEEMYQHLKSADHSEVISVINRSVPIEIKKVEYQKCSTCSTKFLLLIQLKKHIEKTGHSAEKVADEYKCDICMQNLNSEIALQRHRKNIHNIKSFICGTCKLTFSTSEEVKEHRNSANHHSVAIEKKDNGAGKSLERKCQYCQSIFENFLKLKEHIKTEHVEFHPKCPRCGMSFIVPQDLSVHLRAKACKLEQQETKKYICSLCPFSDDSEANLLFHEILHSEPVRMYPDRATTSDKKPLLHYKCSKCQKFFPRPSLLGHLRLHTEERPFKCTVCDKTFVRKNNWLFHEKKHNTVRKEPKGDTQDVKERPHLCSTCGASFKKRFILQQHMKIHTGKSFKCIHKDCIFTGRSLGELKIHFKTHFDHKNFSCQSCDYRGKTKQQLQRHMTVHEEIKKFKCSHCSFTARTSHHLKRHSRLHTGSKPYNCPHCTYSCNSLENLRKHILRTSMHPGKSIYECKYCKGDRFQTNFFKEFKAHLLTLHPNEMDKGDRIKSSSVYEAKKDQFLPIGNSNAQLKAGSSPEVLVLKEEANLKVVVEEVQQNMPSLQLVPLIVPKGERMEETGSENWSLVGCYDVSESGALIPFNKDVLFEDVI